MTGPSREDPTFHGASLTDAPRVACSSILIRILSVAAARAAMRRKAPVYADRSAHATILNAFLAQRLHTAPAASSAAAAVAQKQTSCLCFHPAVRQYCEMSAQAKCAENRVLWF